MLKMSRFRASALETPQENTELPVHQSNQQKYNHDMIERDYLSKAYPLQVRFIPENVANNDLVGSSQSKPAFEQHPERCQTQ